MERKMAKAIRGFDAEVQTYWANRKANGAEGLKLLHKCIEDTAKHRSWDGLSRFFTLAKKHGQGPRVALIIRAAFGDKLTYKANAKHPTGGEFIIGWDSSAPFNLRGNNVYPIIMESIDKGEGWDSASVNKLLREKVAKPTKPAKIVDAETQTKAAKALAKKLAELRDAGFDLGALRNEIDSILATKDEPSF
jgi:hypothetical protein